MTEHTIIINSVGGAITVSCEALDIRNIEYGFSEVTAEGIKKRVLEYKYMTDDYAKFDLLIIDNRPEPVNFNDFRSEESKIMKKNHNSMETPRR